MTAIADKVLLKEILRELFVEDKAFFQEMFTEILNENSKIAANEDADDAEINTLIRKNFDRYEKTFKALA